MGQSTNNPTPDNLSPLPPSADMKAYKRAWRARRKAMGVCTTCGGERDTLGRVRCSACLAKDNENYATRGRTAYRKRAAVTNETAKERRARWKAAGLCSWCGGKRQDRTKRRCGDCLAKTAKARAKETVQRQSRRRRKLCPRCGRQTSGLILCPNCLNRGREEYRRSLLVNPNANRVNSARRRFRLQENGGHYTAEDWEQVKAAQDYTCLVCGRREPEVSLQADHAVSVAKGGPNSPWNIQGLCESCNKSKGSKCVDLRHLAKWPLLYPQPPLT
jgi:5-methylcytosine-specific restriction endonuclease McrA